MSQKISKSDKELMKKFVKLYFDKIELEYALIFHKKDNSLKKELEKVDKEITPLLTKYSIIFNDVNALLKTFDSFANKQKNAANSSFEFFLKYTFEELYNKKIISKKDYEQLKKWLLSINLKISNLGLGAMAGSGL